MSKDKESLTKFLIDNNLLLNTSNQDLRANKSEYQHRIRSWIYLGILIRPDIAYTIRRLSQFIVDPTMLYLRALKKLSKYVRSSVQLSITFRRDRNKTLEGYSDSDFAIDKSDRIRPHTGVGEGTPIGSFGGSLYLETYLLRGDEVPINKT
jgi:hypothetical protein